MTDRELLELAAKAAGIKKTWRTWTRSRIGRFGCIEHTKHEGLPGWNPLEDSGDAFTLQVTLKLSVEVNEASAVVNTWQSNIGETKEFIEYFDCPEEAEAAARHAIVRAAAEIGKTL